MGLMSRMKGAQDQARSAMANSGGMSGLANTMRGDMTGQAAYAQLAQRLNVSGVEAPGVIDAIAPSGVTEFGGGQQVAIDVTVTPAGGAPYRTTIRQALLPAQLEGMHEGGACTVKYDPDNPAAALLYGW